jgi:hypothetical protein
MQVSQNKNARHLVSVELCRSGRKYRLKEEADHGENVRKNRQVLRKRHFFLLLRAKVRVIEGKSPAVQRKR